MERAVKTTAEPGGGGRLRAIVRLARAPFPYLALLVALHLAVGYRYLTLNADRSDLERRIGASSAALRKPAPDLPGLELTLEQTEARLEELKGSRTRSTLEEDLFQYTLRTAARTGVAVTGGGTRADTVVTRGGQRVRATPFFLIAKGSLEQLRVFLAEMESGSLETLEIQSAAVESDGTGQTLTLSAIIYSHLPYAEAVEPTPTATPAGRRR